MDFTELFYIASFFAIEAALQDACVWAINETAFSNSVYDKTSVRLNEIIKFAKTFVKDISKKENLVLTMTPSRVNERLAVQRGKFLFPCNSSKGFEINLCATFDFTFDTLYSKNAKLMNSQELERAVWNLEASSAIVKINLSKEWYREAIRDLYSMNIDAASLFPGLDCFARSLNFIIQGPEKGAG